MLKHKKYMISLLITVISAGFINANVALAVSDTASATDESIYKNTEITGKDSNNIIWAYSICSDGTIAIEKSQNSDLSGNIEIPDKLEGRTVSSIADGGLSYSTNIISLKIPNTVKSIGRDAFYGCISLSNIEIPESVNEIHSFAFENTPWLTGERKSNPLVVVNNILIDGKDASGDIVIPSNVTIIGDSAFASTSVEGQYKYRHGNPWNITSLVIPEGVTQIGENAFQGCTQLTKLKIPFTVTEIGDGAFAGYGGDSIEIENKAVKIGSYICPQNVKINIGPSDIANQNFQGQGWYKNGEYWNWLWSNGTKLTGWYQENGEWYYFYGNGQMATEFIDLGGYSYYFKINPSDGKAAMVTGWQCIDGKWFYFNPDSDGYKGLMKRACWSYIDGNWYYFYYDGQMARNTYVDGYYVNSSGAWS